MPGVEPWGWGWSRDAKPWGLGCSQQLPLRQEHSRTVRPGVRRRLLLGTRVRSAFITYGRERALVLQGPEDGGTRRVSVAQVGAGGCAFRGGSGSPPQDGRLSQTARLRAPTSQGQSGPLGGFNPISCRVPAPSSPSVTSQIPGITTSSRSACSGPESRQEAGRSLRGLNGPGRGKSWGRRLHPLKSSAKPRGHRPHPLPGS